MKKLFIIVAVVVVLGFAAWKWFTLPQREHDLALLPAATPTNVTWLDVGLSREEEATWHHLSEGSELMPLSFLEALKNPKTGQPFFAELANYGFLVESLDPHHLPVGWTMQMKPFGGRDVPFIGINCSACHSGEIRYRGQSMRIDGAPNMFALEKFFLDMQDALAGMKKSPLQAFLFVRDVVRLNHSPAEANELLESSPAAVTLMNSVKVEDGLDKHEGDIVDVVGSAFVQVIDSQPHDVESHSSLATNAPGLTPEQKQHRGVLRNIVETFRKEEEYIERRLATVEALSKAIDSGVDLGPGRGDSFGIIRDLLFPDGAIKLDAPVSTPALFDLKNFTWIHWDGNTTSVMDRNIAQAIALGADFDPKTSKSTVLPHNLYKLEQVASKIRAPAWPEAILGKIDAAKARRGEAHYMKLCHECHQKEALYDQSRLGTSPYRAANFAGQLAGQPFVSHLVSVVGAARDQVYKDHGITPGQARSMERHSEPTWRSTRGYLARPLRGIWATAPYLHNGSVATLDDLLKPAAQRLAKFPVGQREFDPVKVGYVTEVAEPYWIFDTTIPGNANSGHEFGAGLPDASRQELIEHLKTL